MRSIIKIMKPLRNIFIFSFLFLATTAIALFAPSPETTRAVGAPFGGKISAVFYCSCSQNLLLTISPPVATLAVYQPAVTQTFPYGQVYRPGAWALGNWLPGGACLIPIPPPVPGCAPISNVTISIVSTSL